MPVLQIMHGYSTTENRTCQPRFCISWVPTCISGMGAHIFPPICYDVSRRGRHPCGRGSRIWVGSQRSSAHPCWSYCGSGRCAAVCGSSTAWWRAPEVRWIPADGSSGDADAAQVLRRCEDIYRQAAEHYNNTLRRPLIHVPGYLMGFHREPDMPECGCGTSQKTA